MSTENEAVRGFEAYIKGLCLRHFEPREFVFGLDRGNALPPVHLWGNFAITATLLDRLRGKLGRPIQVTSAYRSPAYNGMVGGAPGSQHMAFTAVDFVVKGGAEPAEYAGELKAWRGELFRIPKGSRVKVQGVPFRELETWDLRHGSESMIRFRGGVGVYQGFVHLDTRGFDVDWNG